jgi:hypothetical protein
MSDTTTISNDKRWYERFFGWNINDPATEEKKNLPSIVPAVDEDGAGYITASGSHFGQYVNIDGNEAKDNAQLIRQYRGVAMHPEVDMAIEDIVNEAISGSEFRSTVDLIMDNVKIPDNLKKKITTEFDAIVAMLKFNELGHDIFRRWYVDGRIYHHLVVDETKPGEGIQDIRPIDAAKMRKVKEVKSKKDPKTGAKIIEKVNEYFIYQEKPGQVNSGIKLTHDSVSYVTSGLLDQDRKKVVSYLHKAMKAINQLKMMEDSLVIYRLARAPERRIFYIDVANLPTKKAEEYMKGIMTRYRNKLVYDNSTGQLKDDRKHMSMLEDFWLPRREGSRGTEISTLPGGDNLGQIDDIIYFQKKLYKSLSVPIGHLDHEANMFSMGRTNEITKEEMRFQKFIDRQRVRFASVFLEILRKQLLLKKIITEEDWNLWKNDIKIDYVRDNHIKEMIETELWRERIQNLDQFNNYVGEYFAKEWIMKNVLRMSDDTIEEMKKLIEEEMASGVIADPEETAAKEQEAQADQDKKASASQTHNVKISVDGASQKKESVDPLNEELQLAALDFLKDS